MLLLLSKGKLSRYYEKFIIIQRHKISYNIILKNIVVKHSNIAQNVVIVEPYKRTKLYPIISKRSKSSTKT